MIDFPHDHRVAGVGSVSACGDARLVGRAGGGAALRDDDRGGDGGDEGDGGKGGNAAHGRSPVGTAEEKRRQGTASTSGGETKRFVPRSEECRVGKECVRTCRTRRVP